MRRAVAASSAALLALALAGTVSAANPNQTYDMAVCYAGADHVVIEQTWSALNVDHVDAVMSDGNVGLGASYDIPRARTGTESANLGYDSTATLAIGALLFHGKVVASDSVSRPAAGWTALPAC